MNQVQVQALVAAELQKASDPDRRAALARILVAPAEVERGWGYSDDRFETWTVARDDGSGVELVFALGAFGDPWGWLPIGDDDLGMDSQWFTTLDDAFISAVWKGPLPPGYEVR